MDASLPQLVEQLTTSGEPQLNPEKMKELKKICKSSEEQLGHAHRLLMTQLGREHAEVRLSAFQVLAALFARSHHFRTLVVADFQEFLELTLGTDCEQPLPPPREAAQRLRQAAVRAVAEWNERFGEAYKKLAVGYHFLRNTKKVDFQDMDARTVAQRRREDERRKHLDKIHRERAEQAAREMEDASGEVGACLAEVESCIRLLLPFDLAPGPKASFLPGAPGPQDEEQPCCSRDLAPAPGEGPSQAAPWGSSEDEADSDREDFLRSHGLGSRKYTLDLELSADSLRVRENEDNVAVIHAARDALKLIRNKFLPAVCSWVQRFTRAGTHGAHLKHAIHLKTELELALRKCEELDLEPGGGPRHRMQASGEEDEDEDEDFVEVPEKEGYEAHIPAHLWPECGLEPKGPLLTPEKDHMAHGMLGRTRTRLDEEASDPTSAAAQLQRLQAHLPPPPPCSPCRAPLGPEEAQKLAAERARAPVVPFGVDLCYWGDEQLAAGRILKAPSEHRFWKPSEVQEEVDSAQASEALCTRRIPFAGSFEPVQHRCRALRPDGQLCQRQDRLKVSPAPPDGRAAPFPELGRTEPPPGGCSFQDPSLQGAHSAGSARCTPRPRQPPRPLQCPFHGKIIPRDDQGQPLDPADRAREQQQQLRKRPGWQDAEFMRDVEVATGEDLGSARCKGKGRGRKRLKYPGLTDLKGQADTARTRIGKKVFAKAAVRRVVAAMNQMDRKKHEKFANQFNYALN